MARPKKEAHPFSIKMDANTYSRLQLYCLESGQPKTVAIERAINMFIDAYESKNGQLHPKSIDIIISKEAN